MQLDQEINISYALDQEINILTQLDPEINILTQLDQEINIVYAIGPGDKHVSIYMFVYVYVTKCSNISLLLTKILVTKSFAIVSSVT